MGTSLLLFSPLEFEGDDFSENVNLIIQDLSNSPLSLDAYTDLSDQQIKALAHKEAPLISERLTKDNRTYHRYYYQLQMGPNLIQIETYAWVEQTQAIVLTFSCKVDSKDDYTLVGRRILDSFKIY